MKTIIFYLMLLMFSLGMSTVISGQNSISPGQNTALNIYLDCGSCDLDYIKEKLLIVNYVRGSDLSDLHVLITSQNTGSGGTEYSLFFNGKGKFFHLNDTIVFATLPDCTNEEIRMIMLEKLKLGLVPYILKTCYADNLLLDIDNTGISRKTTIDHWKSWIFELEGTGSLFHEKYSRNYIINGHLYAGKVTPEIKIESSSYLNYSELHFTLPAIDTIYFINSIQYAFYSNNLFVQSLGEHFGFGGIVGLRNNLVSNLDLQIKIGPCVEYNVFKYKDASRKQLRFLYSINYEHVNYHEVTINDKMSDNLYRQNLSILFMDLKTWGNFSASLVGSNYIHDFSKFSIGTICTTSIRINNGLFFTLACGLHMQRDQLDLRKGNASVEEILIYKREMESDLNYSVSIGLSFRFGSKYNNTVNPRFER